MKIIKDASQVPQAVRGMRSKVAPTAPVAETAQAAAGSAQRGRARAKTSPVDQAAVGASAMGKKPPGRAKAPPAPVSVYLSRIAPLPRPRDGKKITRAQMQTLLDSVTMPKFQRAFTERVFKTVVPEHGLEGASANEVLENLFRSVTAQSQSFLENLTQDEYKAYAQNARTTDFWGTITNLMLVLLDSRRSQLKDPALDYKDLREEHLPQAQEFPGPPEAMRTAG